MKTRMLNAFLALLLVLSFSLIPATPARAATINVPGDYPTIQAAINSPSVVNGDTILVGPGPQAGALVTKRLEIKGLDGAVINSGPLHGSGQTQGFRLLAGSGGTTISHLTFKTDLSIMNGAAVNNVTIEHNTFLGSVQAISNWRGSAWTIRHNNIVDLKTRNGGGIGVLLGDYTGKTVETNVVSHNKISGTLYVGGWYSDPGKEKGGYNGSGIVLYADFRWGSAGAKEIKNNRVVQNHISMVSNNATLVDVVAIELTDTRDDPAATPVVFGNAIGFNDLRGTANQIDLTPGNLGDNNNISRNLGDNRGHGLPPSLFGPGGN
ncbi:MAG: hypothetical protein HY673_16995 [Chloroflexi bacterium]|nr:hypothetical protein [Chloroflexota bacterium]